MSARCGSIFLIGMMGVGKTTIGRLLAQAAGVEFVDCDRELEVRAGTSITTIFEVEGEEGFRRREAALLDELTQRRGIVLATGGGAVLREENRRVLRERGLVVYLQSTVDEIVRRTRRDTTRPLLQAGDPRARVEQLLREREPLYRQTAHLSFQSGSTNPKKLVKRILAHPDVVTALGIAR
jgi:shikimate kinase